MTPYVVTVRRGVDTPEGIDYRGVSRRAVATLDEAREEVKRIEQSHNPVTGAWGAEPPLPESGGTVGPLPDGTVIEVESVGWEAFGDYLLPRGMVRKLGMEEAGRRVIAAYNEAQA